MSRRAQFGWRQWVALFALFAFTAQVQITQTHIHFAASSSSIASDSAQAVAKHATGTTTSKKNLPGNDDPGNCPVCQAIAHGGQFVTPSAIVFALPTIAVAFISLAITANAARDSISHNWQGRAPPHA